MKPLSRSQIEEALKTHQPVVEATEHPEKFRVIACECGWSAYADNKPYPSHLEDVVVAFRVSTA